MKRNLGGGGGKGRDGAIGGRGSGGGGGRPPYRPGLDPKRPPKYPIVRLKYPLMPQNTGMSGGHVAPEFGKLSLDVPDMAFVTRIYQPISLDTIKLMVGESMRGRLRTVVEQVSKKGLKVISATIALGAAVSLIKAFENRQIVDTFRSSASGNTVDEAAIEQVLTRWSERIEASSSETISDAEMVEAFLDAFGYDEVILSGHDLERMKAVMPHSATEVHALVYAIQKSIYDAFVSARRMLHDKNVELFGTLFAPLAEVMEETAVEICFEKAEIGAHMKELKDGYELGEKLDKKIRRVVEDMLSMDVKSFVLDIGGEGGVFSILYKLIASDVRRIVESTFEDVVLVWDSMKTARSAKQLEHDMTALQILASKTKANFETVDTEDTTLAEDVKSVFGNLADATNHLRSLIASFPRHGHVKGVAKQVLSRSKVGLKAFAATFTYVKSHIKVQRGSEDEFRLVLAFLQEGRVDESVIDVTELVVAVVNACERHKTFGDDTREVMMAMQRVMSEVLDRMPEDHRRAWKQELLDDAIRDQSIELVKHAEKVVFGDSKIQVRGGESSVSASSGNDGKF